MTPLVGLSLHGHHLAPGEPVTAGEGRLGEPRWSPLGLLKDLEGRLGLCAPEDVSGLRVEQWLERLRRADDGQQFYSRSFAADAQRTAAEILRWRDGLVEAGWNGDALHGSDRLATLARLEASGSPLALGRADRIRRLCAALPECKVSPYERLEHLEALSLWPLQWQRVFGLLKERGTAISQREPAFDRAHDTESDLGRLQALVASRAIAPEGSLRADGTVLVLTGETPIELADAVAAYAASCREALTLVRNGEGEILDGALRRAGLGSQGVVHSSDLRPLSQVAPLLLQLGYEQRDPAQLLQLLTLPRGPFANRAGWALSRALMEAPGLRSTAWLEAYQEHQQELGPFARVLTGSGWPASGAPLAELLEVVDAALGWLQKRLAREDSLERVAFAGAKELRSALEATGRDTLDRVMVQQICLATRQAVLGSVVREQSRRVQHVDAPAALLQPAERALFWNCVGAPTARTVPWRRAELRALEQQDIRFPSPDEVLAEQARGYRRPIEAATRQLVLAIPRQSLRQLNRTHPLFDEVCGRLRLDERSLARVTVSAAELRQGTARHFALKTRPVAPLALPVPRAAWRVPEGLLQARDSLSASSLNSLISCPLRWVLDYEAGLRYGGPPGLPPNPIVFGNLADHLVQRLHERGAFRGEPAALRDEVGRCFDELVEEEAMMLLGQGKSFERANLRSQLQASIAGLAQLLRENGLEIASVQEPLAGEWERRAFRGNIDLLLRRSDGVEVIVDLKWGSSTYETLLEKGWALQLAVYGAARRLSTDRAAALPSAYYAVAGGKLLATDAAEVFGLPAVKGAPVAATWERATKTLPLIEGALGRGRIPVTGLPGSPGLLEGLGVGEALRAELLEFEPEIGCKYCNHAALCGQHWGAE